LVKQQSAIPRPYGKMGVREKATPFSTHQMVTTYAYTLIVRKPQDNRDILEKQRFNDII